MLRLKKAVIAFLMLSSSAVFAGGMGASCGGLNSTIPCEGEAWGFGVEGLYLEPSTSTNSAFTVKDATGRTINYPSKWAWGFALAGAYHYGTGSDINLNWYHVSKTATKTFSIAPGLLSIPTLGVATPAAEGSSSASPKWDQVNIEFGQLVHYGENKHIRYHGGVQYARIANSTSLLITAAHASGVTNDATVSTSNAPTYNGFGPRLGADMHYDWDNGLGLYANGASALLIGTKKLSHSIAVNDPNGIFGLYSNTVSTSKTTLVPELEAKLGVKWDCALAEGNLTLDLGWMWVNYFNSEESVLSTGLDSVDSDFGIQGPFIGLKWLGDVS